MKNLLKISIVVIVSTTIGFFSAISFSQIQIKTIKIDDKKTSEEQKVFLQDVISIVKKDYVEEKTDAQLAEAAANGLLSSLDPHSSYLNEDDLKEMQVQTKGEFGGLGVEITLEYSVVKVISAIEDTPAFEAGIKSGDYISKIEDKSTVGMSINDVVKQLRGKAGTKVTITILRKGEKEPLVKTIVRQIIKVKAVRSAQFGDIAYVKINSFSEQAYEGIVKEMKKMNSKMGDKPFKGLVLDLRNNPGGLLDQSIKISDLFLNKGQTIVSVGGRDKKTTKYYKDESDENLVPNIPIVVLVNEGSASASEIVAGALQDNNRAVVMGIKSFGKGSVQTVIPLDKNNGALRLTTALYYTPSGKSIQAHGIDPNVVVIDAKIEKSKDLRDSEADLKGHIEVQLQSAIEESKKNQMKDDNLELYDKDYQLARAIDLLRGIDVYRSETKSK